MVNIRNIKMCYGVQQANTGKLLFATELATVILPSRCCLPVPADTQSDSG